MANKEWELTQNMMFGQFTADDDHWVTINGTHVLIGEGGEIKGGPDGIKEHYSKKSGGSGKNASVNAHGTMDPESLGKAEKRRDALWDKEDHGTISEAEKKELKELQGKIDEHYSTKKEKTGGDPNASAGPKDPAKMTEKEIIAEISKHDAEARAAMNNHNKTKAEAAASRESAARAHELRKELDRRWAAGEKAHGIKGGFENAGKSSGSKSLVGKTYKNDGKALKSAMEDLGYTDFKHNGNFIFSAKKDGKTYRISTTPTGNSIRVDEISTAGGAKTSRTSGGSALVGKTYKNDGKALKAALENLGYTNFKHDGNYVFSAEKGGATYKINTTPTGNGSESKSLRINDIVKTSDSAWDITEHMMVGDFNPYHDEDGRFTTAGGGSDYDDDEDDEDDEEENEDVSALKSITKGQWWGLRSDLEEELADAGFDVLESNAEWIDVASPNQGADAQYLLRLGGTERTVIVNSIETLDYNPNHDPDDGRFTSGGGGASKGSAAAGSALSQHLPSAKSMNNRSAAERVERYDSLPAGTVVEIESSGLGAGMSATNQLRKMDHKDSRGRDWEVISGPVNSWGHFDERFAKSRDMAYGNVKCLNISNGGSGSEAKKPKKTPIPKSAVSVSGEDQYRFANGKKPSGWGQWGFKIGKEEFWHSGSYTEAKKAAIAKAAEAGEWSVKVLT